MSESDVSKPQEYGQTKNLCAPHDHINAGQNESKINKHNSFPNEVQIHEAALNGEKIEYWSHQLQQAFRLLTVVLCLVMIGQWLGLKSWRTTASSSFTFEESTPETLRLVEHDGAPMMQKYARYPLMQYLHILPAPIWTILCPLQFWGSLRRKYPKLHRFMGRIFVALSCTMSLGLILIIKDNIYYGDLWLERPFAIISSVYFVVSLFKAMSSAFRRDFISHRCWMLRHSFNGFGVHLMRLLVYINGLVSILPNATVEDRKYSFAMCACIAFMLTTCTAEFWIFHTKI